MQKSTTLGDHVKRAKKLATSTRIKLEPIEAVEVDSENIVSCSGTIFPTDEENFPSEPTFSAFYKQPDGNGGYCIAGTLGWAVSLPKGSKKAYRVEQVGVINIKKLVAALELDQLFQQQNRSGAWHNPTSVIIPDVEAYNIFVGLANIPSFLEGVKNFSEFMRVMEDEYKSRNPEDNVQIDTKILTDSKKAAHTPTPYFLSKPKAEKPKPKAKKSESLDSEPEKGEVSDSEEPSAASSSSSSEEKPKKKKKKSEEPSSVVVDTPLEKPKARKTPSPEKQNSPKRVKKEPVDETPSKKTKSPQPSVKPQSITTTQPVAVPPPSIYIQDYFYEWRTRELLKKVQEKTTKSTKFKLVSPKDFTEFLEKGHELKGGKIQLIMFHILLEQIALKCLDKKEIEPEGIKIKLPGINQFNISADMQVQFTRQILDNLEKVFEHVKTIEETVRKRIEHETQVYKQLVDFSAKPGMIKCLVDMHKHRRQRFMLVMYNVTAALEFADGEAISKFVFDNKLERSLVWLMKKIDKTMK